MKFKGFWYDGLMIFVAAAFAIAFIIMTFFFDSRLALAECMGFVLVCVIAVYRALSAKNRYKKFLIKTARKLDYKNSKVLSEFPFPVAVCDAEGCVTWCNNRFLAEIAKEDISAADNISKFTDGLQRDALVNREGAGVFVDGRYYTVFSVPYKSSGTEYCALYFLDNTNLKKTELEYFNSRPYAVLIEMDNLDGSRTDLRDSEVAEIRSRLEGVLDDWAESYGSVMKKISEDRYLIITERINFSKMTEDRFSILETVRNFEYKDVKTGATLSVGVSGGDTVRACEKSARKALEMALGRGGDQVAIKHKDGYDYIGGVSKSAEKRNKVRSRIVGSALAELIKSSSNVIVMGHSYTDLDAIGSAVGIASAVQSFGIPVYIATDKKKTLASPLIEKLDIEGMSGLIIGQEKALELLDKKSLLIVVDTHIESFVEFPKLYEKAETKVIIDHHRRAAADIEDAVIFHHDPGASSASEMVTELLQYMNPEMNISKTVAEALLAGIMLDTKDFVIGTGVRTFEAAAFLKEKKADMISVKKLFANSLEVNKLRTRVISSAENFMGCAVSVVDFDSPDVRIIAAQAADELLKVSGIKASFVMFENAGAINISARSLGEINVQIIMESLGGGGHQTMAACQLKDYDMTKANFALQGAINNFFENN
ncbi:MAG: DHH family phosphoesterase [Acutalibacteraceae bacterium]|nr:DHH family phosphoesterase [Acutalibacteraceae bacterium]